MTRASFFVILVLISFCLGSFSAFTKFWASDVTSTPDPAPMEDMIFCALALFAAAIEAAVEVLVLAAETLDAALEVEELTAVVAMTYFLNSVGESDQLIETEVHQFKNLNKLN